MNKLKEIVRNDKFYAEIDIDDERIYIYIEHKYEFIQLDVKNGDAYVETKKGVTKL